MNNRGRAKRLKEIIQKVNKAAVLLSTMQSTNTLDDTLKTFSFNILKEVALNLYIHRK